MKAVQNGYLKPSLVNLILKDVNLAFYLSVANWFYLQSDDFDVIIDFRVDSTILMSFKKCNVMLTWKDTCSGIDNIYQANVQQCSKYEK